jgi:hypothetical protein
VNDIRPELPNRSTDTVANAALQAQQRSVLENSNFSTLSPSVTISSPSPGTSFARGSALTVTAPATSVTNNIQSAVLEIDGTAVARRVLDRRDQDSTDSFDFIFIYDIPSNRAVGSMDITVRVFNITSALQGMVADGAPDPNIDITTGLGTLDGRAGSATSSDNYQKLFAETGILRTPEGVVSISVNIT